MFKVMDNPILIENGSDTDQQLAKSIANGSVGTVSRGTPIIDELWSGEIRPFEMMKSNEYEPVNAPAAKQPAIKPVKVKEPEKPKPIEFPTAKSLVADAISSLTEIFKSDDEDEDDEDKPEEKFKVDKKETAEKSASSTSDVIKGDDEESIEDTQMTDSQAVNASDKDANKDDSESDEEDDSEKSLGEVLDDLIKAGTGEGSRGGKIIGHTKSGKPIYESHNLAHDRFNSTDHKEAADLHLNHSNGDRDHDSRMAEYHKEAAVAKEKNSPTLHDSMGKHHKEEANKRSNARPLSPAVQARRNELDRFPAAASKKGIPDEPGSHVIGSTKSGKDIYSNANHPTHAFFTSRDHYDAIDHHSEKARDAKNSGNSGLHEKHLKEISAHATQAHVKGTEEDAPNEAFPHMSNKDVEHSFSTTDKAGHRRFRDLHNGMAVAYAHDPLISTQHRAMASYHDAAADRKGDIEARAKTKKSLPEGDLSKSTALGVDEIKVDEWGIPIHCGDAVEVHDGDKAMLKELIQAGVIDPEHEMDKRVPQVINRVFGGVY